MKIAIIALLVIAIVGAGGYLLLKNRPTPNDLPEGATTSTSMAPSTTNGNPSDAKVAVGTAAAREITIEASEYKFTPSTITVKKGETVRLTLKNTGKMQHDWVVEKMAGASIDIVNPGQSGSITLTASQTGTFTTFCSVGSHRQLGMVGKLIVE